MVVMPVIYQAGQSIDHYEIIKQLGQGGASRVYLARDRRAQQEVVLKFPNIDELGSADVYARYQREVKIGKLLNHPHIQHHLDSDETHKTEYLVLEYMRGLTLREAMHLQAPERLPIDRIIHIVAQVVDALVYAHGQGVIHRDIKPENIMLLENGDVVLFDFGIAQWRNERFLRLRGFGKPIGTPAYMPPELLLGNAALVQSDIYGVGALLYELLCGETPFGERNGFDFLTEHTSHDPTNILTHNPTLSPALASVVMRCIRRDPDRRYLNMQALLDDLLHLDKVKPVAYIPDPPKIGGRYRPIIRGTIIVLLVLVAIVAFGILVQFAHHAAK
jgi:eukaryotic-like serine/threonine-protein kinase